MRTPVEGVFWLMRPTLYPWQLLSVIAAGMLNEHQQRVIDYLNEIDQTSTQEPEPQCLRRAIRPLDQTRMS